MLPFLNSLFNLGFVLPISVSIGSGYLLFICLGYLISNSNFSRTSQFVIYSLSIFELLLHMIGTYDLSMAANQVISTYKGYNNLPCVLYSAGIFLFFKRLGTSIMSNKLINKIVQKLSSYTFGVYLTHVFVLQTIFRMFPNINSKLLVWRAFSPLLVFTISVVITWIIRKIPGLKKIMP